MTFAKAGGCLSLLFVVEAVVCAAGLLFWPVGVIMVGFFTVREFDKLWPMACLGVVPVNRMATCPEFHNLKVIFIYPPMVEFGTAH
jgi:hypothetical protein